MVNGRRGFTLVEVLVALVVLEVGILGVMGTLVLAARTLSRAEAEEEGVAEVGRVADSLVAAGGGGDGGGGHRRTARGEVVWSVAPGSMLHLVFSTPLDSALVVANAAVGETP